MTDKSLFFITLALICVWIILDNFYGKKYLNTFLLSIFPSLEKTGLIF